MSIQGSLQTTQTSGLIYRDGDAPHDKERQQVTQSGLLSAGITLVSIVGLGTIGVPLLSVTGLGAIGFGLVGLVMVAVDYTNSQDDWESLDALESNVQGFEVLPKILVESENNFIPAQTPILTPDESNFINVESVTVIPEPLIIPTVLEVQPIVAKPSGFGGNVQKPSFSSQPVEPTIEMKPKKDRPTAVNIFISDPYESRCIFGSQRTGKSYFAAVVSAKLALKGTRIYHINLASYGVEDFTYWQHAYKSVCADISAMDTYDAKFQIDKATQLIFEFYADPNPSILIVDEIAYLGSTGNYHKASLEKMVTVMADKITVLSSSGKKRKKAIWTIAPEFVAGAVTQDTKAIKKLTLCYLTIHPEKTVDWEGQDIGFNSSLFDQIKTNYSIFYPVDIPDEDRVVFIGDQWMSIGDLEASKTVEAKVTLPKSTKVGSGLTLFQRASMIADSSTDLLLSCDVWEMEETQDEPATIKRLEAICLESALK